MTAPQPVSRLSADITADQLTQLYAIFPEAFTESRVDFEKLRATLGDLVDERPDRYSFTWAGKRDAIHLLQLPTTATLVPCREESVNFDTTQHLFIEGDNLEVLKLLYKPYFGRIKMIYIDPPYNTGNDFIYPDNYTDPLDTYLQLTGQQDAEGNRLTSNPETSGRYHSAWLSMMYPRLFIARQLLREDGVIFVSIDDNEVHNLRLVMNEIFGEENFRAQITWQKKYAVSNNYLGIASIRDFILVYARSANFTNGLIPRSSESADRYSNPDNDPRGPWKAVDYWNQASPEQRPNLVYPITNPNTGQVIYPSRKAWKVSREVYEEHSRTNRIWWGQDGKNTVPALKLFLSDVRDGMIPHNWWSHKEVGHTDEANKELQSLFDGLVPFDTPKPTRLLRRILQIANVQESDIVLDFFAGSATTAHSILDLNRSTNKKIRFIMVQLPEPTPKTSPASLAGYSTVAEISKERLRRVVSKMKQRDSEQFDVLSHNDTDDIGFRVFKLASSHFQSWRGIAHLTSDEYIQQMELFTEPLRPDWILENVIWEVAIKEGFSLTTHIESIATGDHLIYRVTDHDRHQHFYICLDNQITADIAVALGLTYQDTFVCRDTALDDTTAANLALQCRLKTI